jgi:hypothetical protein
MGLSTLTDTRKGLLWLHPDPRLRALTCLPGTSSYRQRASREGAWERQWVHLWPPLVLLSPTPDTIQAHPFN